ncbi:hypothetical protein Tco_0502867, partial [Tanacetum coccineum]
MEYELRIILREQNEVGSSGIREVEAGTEYNDGSVDDSAVNSSTLPLYILTRVYSKSLFLGPPHKCCSDDDNFDLPLIYHVNGHSLHFGRREFCLLTGFEFGSISFCEYRNGDILFRNRLFLEKIG